MKIIDIRATPVTVPLEAPLRHSNGAHWGRFVRTLVEVETDDGLVGLGEMGGGGESATAAFAGLKPYLLGHDPFRLEELRFKIANPTASLYNNRTQLLAAIEFACFDLVGQHLGVPVHALLGGKLRDTIPFASYLFFRPPDGSGNGEVRTPDQLVKHALDLKKAHGFTTHKMKGGVFPPAYELECYRALAAALPGDRFRFDPNCAWSVDQALRFGRAIESIDNDYFEDPTYGLNGLRQVRAGVRIPTATNTVVVNFEQLATNVLAPAADVVLLDTTFWGGIRPCVKAAAVCETFQMGVSVHSSGELGIQLATMLHLGAVLANLTYAADATITISSTTSSRAENSTTSTVRLGCRNRRASASGWMPTRWRNTPSSSVNSALTPTTAIRPGRTGTRSCRTPGGLTQHDLTGGSSNVAHMSCPG